MTDKTDHPFQPGVEVAVSHSSPGGGDYWRRGKVAKVYKTGRFVLEGDDQQYRASATSKTPYPYGETGWSGRSTAAGYGGSSVYLLTPEYVEKIVQYLRIRQGRDAIATLNAITGKLAPDFFTAEVVADLQRLAHLAMWLKP